MLIAGLVVFVAASVLSAVAPSLGMLVAGRAIQGLGGAILIALPMSLARDLVPTDRLGTAMGLLGTTSAIGTALGPSLGGVLLALSDWRMAFWLLAGFAAATLVLSVKYITHDPKRADGSFRDLDFPGTLMLVIALAAYALATSGGAAGIHVSPGMLICVALLSIAFFVIIENRAASPLVPMALLRDRGTGLGFAMNWTVGTIMMSTLVIGPFSWLFHWG